MLFLELSHPLTHPAHSIRPVHLFLSLYYDHHSALPLPFNRPSGCVAVLRSLSSSFILPWTGSLRRELEKESLFACEESVHLSVPEVPRLSPPSASLAVVSRSLLDDSCSTIDSFKRRPQVPTPRRLFGFVLTTLLPLISFAVSTLRDVDIIEFERSRPSLPILIFNPPLGIP